MPIARYLAVADELERAQVPMPIVFGHHDLLPGNFIDDGRRLWLIDWEYGAFGTAMFDLANLSSNGAFGAAEDAALLDAYFEGKVEPTCARAFAAMKAASALARGAVGDGLGRSSEDAGRRLRGACPRLSPPVRGARGPLIA